MLRPLTRSSSGKLGRNTRNSSKILVHSWKNKTTKHQGTPLIRKSSSRKSVNGSNLTTSTPKTALLISSSKGKRLSNKPNHAINVSKNRLSQSKSILKTPKTSLNSKDIIEIERSISTDSKRMTRSSTGSTDGGNVLKNRSLKSGLAVSISDRPTEKHIQSKKSGKEKELNVTTKRVTRSSIGNSSGDATALSIQRRSISTDSKRMTRSSTGSTDGGNVLKNRSLKSGLAVSISDRPTEKHIQSKKSGKEKELNVTTKRVTRSSIGNSSGDATALSIHGDVEKPLKSKTSNRKKSSIISNNSKHVTSFSFKSIIESTPLVKKIHKSKILIAPSPLSPQIRVGCKKTKKEVSITLKDSKQIGTCSLNDAVPSLQLSKRAKEKRQCKTTSINSRKAVQMECVESTSDILMGNTRKSHSGSLPAKELPKRNDKNSAIRKESKRKPTATPRKLEDKNNASSEDSIPLDCLTMDIPNKRPRRHTVDVCIKSKKASNSTTKQQKTKKVSASKKKLRSPPDMSQFPIDCLSTFKPPTENRKNRPKSAPAALKRKSKVAGLRTPIPTKGTLKRKRWMFNALKDKNEGYEDDIFENQKFETPVFRLLNEGDDESDSSSISTPKFGFLLTPAPPKKTPTYKDTISSSDLLLARKNAEEYLFRRNKKRTCGKSMLNSSSKSHISVTSDEVPEKKKLEFSEAMEKVNTITKDLEEKILDESDEDDYFNDE